MCLRYTYTYENSGLIPKYKGYTYTSIRVVYVYGIRIRYTYTVYVYGIRIKGRPFKINPDFSTRQSLKKKCVSKSKKEKFSGLIPKYKGYSIMYTVYVYGMHMGVDRYVRIYSKSIYVYPPPYVLAYG